MAEFMRVECRRRVIALLVSGGVNEGGAGMLGTGMGMSCIFQ